MNEIKNVKIFESKEFGVVKTLIINDDIWFVGKDIAEMLGYNNTKDAIISHVDKEDRQTIQRSQFPTFPLPNRGLTIINESGLYSLILSSKLPKAKEFKKWVTAEVLPSIRKYGLYAVDELLNNPEVLEKALTALKNEREKNKELQQAIEILEPKANYYDLILNCKNTVPISVIAKDYGMSAIHMNNLLHKKGIQYKQGEIWLLYQKYATRGYTQSKTHHHKNSNGKDISRTGTEWTQKGRKFLYDILKSYSILPMIEKD